MLGEIGEKSAKATRAGSRRIQGDEGAAVASQVGYAITFQKNLRPCFMVRVGRFQLRTYTSVRRSSQCAGELSSELFLDPGEIVHHLPTVLR